MMKITPIPNAKRTEPFVPVGHPDYVWTNGADVQATWRRFGWVPLEESKAKEQSEKIITLAIASRFTTVI
jgi:hypothetical protein